MSASSSPLKRQSGQGRAIKGIGRRTSEQTIRKLAVMSLVLMVLILNINRPTAAQSINVIQGTVVDANGALIVGASITLENGNGHEYKTRTDKQGQYRMVAVPPGTYTLTAAAAGFSEVAQTIELLPSHPTTHDIKLKIFLSERVEVQTMQDNLSALTISGSKLAALPQDPRQLLLRLRRLAGATGTPDELEIYVDGFREDSRLPPKEA